MELFAYFYCIYWQDKIIKLKVCQEGKKTMQIRAQLQRNWKGQGG